MKELWNLLLEAQASPNGIASTLIREKREELEQKKEELLEQKNKLDSMQRRLIEDRSI